MSKFRVMTPGVRVQLTGKFLRSTGQVTGGEGHKKWTVQACTCRMCVSGRFVAVDQVKPECDPKSPDYDPQFIADLHAEGGSDWRHINKENLYVIGQSDHRNA
jgi:hypothetical protein